jgi:hypothetical protein
MRSVYRSAAAVMVAAVVLVGCSDTTEETDATAGAESSVAVEQTDPLLGTPPSAEAEAMNNDFILVPGDLLDCGTSILTSGWPTTTVFVAEIAAECILAAANSGTAAQHTFWGRDDRGGIDGTIIRVDGPGAITAVDYYIDPEGNLTSSDTTCQELSVGSFEPPACLTN